MPRAALIVRLIAPCQWIRKVAEVLRLPIGHRVAFLAAAIVIVADAKPRLTVNRMAQLLCGRPIGSNPFHPSRGPLAAILPLFPRRFQLPIPLGLNLLLMSDKHVFRRDVAYGATSRARWPIKSGSRKRAGEFDF